MILDEASVTVMVSDMTVMMRVCCSLTNAGTSCTADYIYSTTTDTSEETHNESCRLLCPQKQESTNTTHSNTEQAIMALFSMH